jgi:predicted SAM-dependent methyltransferase
MDARHRWPFPDGGAAAVFMGQVIEHLDYPWGVRKAIKEACRVLAPGGRLVVITPDFQAIKEKRAGAEVWRNEAKGLCRWPGDEHRWMPTRGLVRRECNRRFGNAEIVNHMNLEPSWPAGSRNPWDCCVVAEKTVY